MLKRLYVDNYKCLVNFEIRFSSLTLLLGQNGSGKSSLLDVVFGIRQLLSGASKFVDVFSPQTRTRWQSGTVQVFEMEVELEGETYSYRLEIEHLAERRVVKAKREHLLVGGKPLFEFVRGDVQLYKDSHQKGPIFPGDWNESALARVAPAPTNRRLTRFLDFARKLMVCGLYPHSFSAEAASEDSMLSRDGSNFAAWYRHMFQERQELVPELNQTLGKVIDGFQSIRLERVGSETRALMIVFEEGDRRFELRLDELSDGERALIANYSLIQLTSRQGYALFLDEPENYVALREIQPWLVALYEACGNTVPQAVLCSHHPELIDYLGTDRCVLLVREVSGATLVREIRVPDDTKGFKLSELVARGWEA